MVDKVMTKEEKAIAAQKLSLLNEIKADVSLLKNKVKRFGVSRELSIVRQHLDNAEMWVERHHQIDTGAIEL